MKNYFYFLPALFCMLIVFSCDQETQDSEDLSVEAESIEYTGGAELPIFDIDEHNGSEGPNVAEGLEGKKYTREGHEDGKHYHHYWTMYKKGGWASIDFPHNQYTNDFVVQYGHDWGNTLRDAVGGLGWKWGTRRKINYYFQAWGSWDFVGVYGWAKSPCIEYYVAESRNSNSTTTLLTGANYVSSYWVDNNKYRFYVKHRSDDNACGWTSFWQYISVREHNAWNSGTVDMNQHINHWNYWRGRWGLGNMSNYGYQVFGIEGFYKQGGMYAACW